jgi:hypothetical protein
MKRKPVQIAVCTQGPGKILVVLADDGTLWQRVSRKVPGGDTGVTKYVSEWKEIPALPSDNSNLTKVA